MSVVISDCPCCKHCYECTSVSEPLKCAAFPDGIPNDYIWGPIDVKSLPECNNGFKYDELVD